MSSEIRSLGPHRPGKVSSSAGAAQSSVLKTIRIGSESWNGGLGARDDEGRTERRAGGFERGGDRRGSLCVQGGRRPLRGEELGARGGRRAGRHPAAPPVAEVVRRAR